MSIRELETIEESIFDESVSHPMQAFAWGKIREKTGLRVVRFGEYEKSGASEILKNVYQMTLHAVPLLRFSVGYIPRSAVPSEAFLEYLKVYCRKYKIIFVKFEPEAHVDAGILPKQLAKSPHPLFYEWTRIIDTTKSVEDLKKELDATTRYNIGLAERKGVVVAEESTDRGFENFYTLYESTTRRQHFGGHTKKYHRMIWDVFHTNGIAHILVARLGDEALAACELWLYKGTLYYTYAGSSMEQRNVKAMNALLWNVILFAKEHGAEKIDLWGILPPESTDANNPWSGFSDFKKGFGGNAVQMIGSFDLVAYPFLYALYSWAYALRKHIGRAV